jgi:D-glycero-D-manno-heptose 1,7-bisphosphate phosphatase
MKAVFLDRDGVLNEDNPDYVWEVQHFHILPRVVEALHLLKEAGYKLIIITNQSGIAKGIYTAQDVLNCYAHLQKACGGIIDEHYFAPYHPTFDSASLTRKPDSLMIEKAIAKFHLDRKACWLVGDSERDIIAGKKQHIQTIKVRTGKNETSPTETDFWANDLFEAVQFILATEK